MNNPFWQITLRELQRICSNQRFWIGFIAVSIILTVAGPFGTLEELKFAERFVYWVIISGSTFFCGMAVTMLVVAMLSRYGLSVWLSRVCGSFVASLPIAFIVWGVSKYGFILDMGDWKVFFRVWFSCIIITSAVNILFYLTKNSNVSSNPKGPEQSPFLDRLPRHLGKNLLHLSTQDHYVEAVTDKGSELILMRFSDALKELSSSNGMQIHRAYWVSLSAIKTTFRKDGKLFIETINGNEFPVSRSHLKKVKEELKLK